MKSQILITVTLLSCSIFTFASPKLDSISGESLLKAEPVTLSAANKKGLVVVFLSSRCPCSNSHIGELKSLATEYPDFNFVAVHSNVDEGPESSKPYFENAALPFPVIEDKKVELANAYQALKTPHSFVIKPDGSIAYQGGVSSSNQFAAADRKYLREALEDLQNDRSVKTPEGRTLGCVISRGEKNVW